MPQSVLLVIDCEFNLPPCGKQVNLNFHYNLELAFHLLEEEKDDMENQSLICRDHLLPAVKKVDLGRLKNKWQFNGSHSWNEFQGCGDDH